MTTIVAETGIRSVVLDIEDDNPASMGVAERLGAERRAPARVAVDRIEIPRTLVVFALTVSDDSRPRDGGSADPFHAADETFAHAVGIRMHVWPGGHGFGYWNAHWADYLGFYARALANCRH